MGTRFFLPHTVYFLKFYFFSCPKADSWTSKALCKMGNPSKWASWCQFPLGFHASHTNGPLFGDPGALGCLLKATTRSPFLSKEARWVKEAVRAQVVVLREPRMFLEPHDAQPTNHLQGKRKSLVTYSAPGIHWAQFARSPSNRCPFSPVSLLVGRVRDPAKIGIQLKQIGYPYSNLLAGGPSLDI